MARIKNKIAAIFLVLECVSCAIGHRDLRSNEREMSTSDSSSSSSEERVLRRHSRRESRYEGLPVEIPVTTVKTTTTESTTKVYPPLDPRYRRIYNPDERAGTDEYPFMAAVLVNNQLWCGSVIVSSDRVLTAAHCLQLQYNNRFFREYVKMLTVRVGTVNATNGGDVRKVTEISFHPNYKPDRLEFNVALLRLDKNLTFSASRQPILRSIQYSHDATIPIDNNILFLGWGSTLGSGGLGQTLLQKVTLPIYDLADCQEVYGKELFTRSNFCAGYIALAKNVCNHDAGGPAILDNKVVGILSFSSKRCDVPDEPAVFTSVGAVADWLDDLLQIEAVEEQEKEQENIYGPQSDSDK